MKKRILGVAFGLAFLLAAIISFSPANAEAQTVGAKKCVCKGAKCEPSAFVSFRKGCGTEPCKNVIADPVIIGGGDPISSGCV